MNFSEGARMRRWLICGVIASLICGYWPAMADSTVANFLNHINAGQPNPEAGFEDYLKATRTSHHLIWTKTLAVSCPVHIRVIPKHMQDDTMKCVKSYLIPDLPSGSEFAFILDKYVFTFFSNEPLPNLYSNKGPQTVSIYKMAQYERDMPGKPHQHSGVTWNASGSCVVTDSSHLTCSSSDGKVEIAIQQTIGAPPLKQ